MGGFTDRRVAEVCMSAEDQRWVASTGTCRIASGLLRIGRDCNVGGGGGGLTQGLGGWLC